MTSSSSSSICSPLRAVGPMATTISATTHREETLPRREREREISTRRERKKNPKNS